MSSTRKPNPQILRWILEYAIKFNLKTSITELGELCALSTSKDTSLMLRLELIALQDKLAEISKFETEPQNDDEMRILQPRWINVFRKLIPEKWTHRGDASTFLTLLEGIIYQVLLSPLFLPSAPNVALFRTHCRKLLPELNFGSEDEVEVLVIPELSAQKRKGLIKEMTRIHNVVKRPNIQDASKLIATLKAKHSAQTLERVARRYLDVLQAEWETVLESVHRDNPKLVERARTEYRSNPFFNISEPVLASRKSASTNLSELEALDQNDNEVDQNSTENDASQDVFTEDVAAPPTSGADHPKQSEKEISIDVHTSDDDDDDPELLRRKKAKRHKPLKQLQTQADQVALTDTQSSFFSMDPGALHSQIDAVENQADPSGPPSEEWRRKKEEETFDKIQKLKQRATEEESSIQTGMNSSTNDNSNNPASNPNNVQLKLTPPSTDSNASQQVQEDESRQQTEQDKELRLHFSIDEEEVVQADPLSPNKLKPKQSGKGRKRKRDSGEESDSEDRKTKQPRTDGEPSVDLRASPPQNTKKKSKKFPPLLATYKTPVHRRESKEGVRRKRIVWTKIEEGHLLEGVRRYGVGHWSKIYVSYPFHAKRTTMDLKDKWRNLCLKSGTEAKTVQAESARRTYPPIQITNNQDETEHQEETAHLGLSDEEAVHTSAEDIDGDLNNKSHGNNRNSDDDDDDDDDDESEDIMRPDEDEINHMEYDDSEHSQGGEVESDDNEGDDGVGKDEELD